MQFCMETPAYYTDQVVARHINIHDTNEIFFQTHIRRVHWAEIHGYRVFD